MQQLNEKERVAKDVFKFVKRIGKGNFGSIWHCQHRLSGAEVAIKVMKKKMMKDEDVTDLREEIAIMEVIDHPNIVSMVDFFDEADYYFLVHELMKGGDVAESINKEYEVSERNLQKIISPLFDATLYLHNKGIVHRDLKPENLLLTQTKLTKATLKIADFGLSCVLEESGKSTVIAGTPCYIAPEILSTQPYDERCDYWSLGVILFLLLTGQLPFQHEEQVELFEQIKAGQCDLSEETWAHVSSQAKDLVQRLLVVDPNQRIEKAELTNHPWLTGEFKASKEILPIGKQF